MNKPLFYFYFISALILVIDIFFKISNQQQRKSAFHIMLAFNLVFAFLYKKEKRTEN